MSVLKDKFKLYFGFGTEGQVQAPLDLTDTPEQRLVDAAADRKFAFSMLEVAEEALSDSSFAEGEVSMEYMRRAESILEEAVESASRIITEGIASAARYRQLADRALRNERDDNIAVSMLSSLSAYTDDPESPAGPGKDEEG